MSVEFLMIGNASNSFICCCHFQVSSTHQEREKSFYFPDQPNVVFTFTTPVWFLIQNSVAYIEGTAFYCSNTSCLGAKMCEVLASLLTELMTRSWDKSNFEVISHHRYPITIFAYQTPAPLFAELGFLFYPFSDGTCHVIMVSFLRLVTARQVWNASGASIST